MRTKAPIRYWIENLEPREFMSASPAAMGNLELDTDPSSSGIEPAAGSAVFVDLEFASQKPPGQTPASPRDPSDVAGAFAALEAKLAEIYSGARSDMH